MVRRCVSFLAALTVLSTAACGGGDDGGGGTDDGEDDGGDGGETIEDMEFSAFLDGDTASEPVTVRLSDYAAAETPGTRIIMISAAAGWCAPCMREAQALPEFAAEFEPRGVAVLVDVFEDQNGDPADPEFVKAWVDNFELTVPVFIDTSFQMGRYVDVDVMPVNLFVDAATMEILEIAQGAETGDDPMKEYRELLDFYLAR